MSSSAPPGRLKACGSNFAFPQPLHIGAGVPAGRGGAGIGAAMAGGHTPGAVLSGQCRHVPRLGLPPNSPRLQRPPLWLPHSLQCSQDILAHNDVGIGNEVTSRNASHGGGYAFDHVWIRPGRVTSGSSHSQLNGSAVKLFNPHHPSAQSPRGRRPGPIDVKAVIGTSDRSGIPHVPILIPKAAPRQCHRQTGVACHASGRTTRDNCPRAAPAGVCHNQIIEIEAVSGDRA